MRACMCAFVRVACACGICVVWVCAGVVVVWCGACCLCALCWSPHSPLLALTTQITANSNQKTHCHGGCMSSYWPGCFGEHSQSISSGIFFCRSCRSSTPFFRFSPFSAFCPQTFSRKSHNKHNKHLQTFLTKKMVDGKRAAASTAQAVLCASLVCLVCVDAAFLLVCPRACVVCVICRVVTNQRRCDVRSVRSCSLLLRSSVLKNASKLSGQFTRLCTWVSALSVFCAPSSLSSCHRTCQSPLLFSAPFISSHLCYLSPFYTLLSLTLLTFFLFLMFFSIFLNACCVCWISFLR